MAQTKSALKAIRQSKKRRLRNRRLKSAVKDIFKKAETALSQGAEEAAKVIVSAIKRIDKAVKKGLIHRNTAARKKSRLVKKLNTIKKSKPA